MTTTDASRWQRLSPSAKAALIVIPAVVLVFGVFVLISYLSQNEASGPGQGQAGAAVPLVREDSHVLDDAGENAPTFVEFLDFECEACGALYPVIEDLREEYAGQVNFVVRYFPLDGHFNSMNAAVAVEAAAQQGQFEAMYSQMFTTLDEWGEKRESEAPRFRGYAEQLGLDMAAYDAAVADPATQARVEVDLAAGEQLGVQGTPSFYLDGVLLQPESIDDLTAAFDAAIAARG